MADITATVEQNFIATATVSTTSSVGITESSDVDTTTNGVQEGSMLAFSATTGKWTSTTTLENQEITGGQY